MLQGEMKRKRLRRGVTPSWSLSPGHLLKNPQHKIPQKIIGYRVKNEWER